MSGAKARVPEDIAFATKPEIARDLIAAALDAQVPCAFVLANSVYGSDSRLRRMLEEHHQAYVLAVRANHHLRFWNEDGLIETDPETLGDALSPADWAAHAAGEGAKGVRLYDWARIRLPWLCDAQWERWLLIRRNRRDPAKQAFISSSLLPVPRSPGWLVLRDYVGPSKSASNALRMSLALISVKPAHGTVGIVT
jgi:hypothetical protein